MPSEEPRVSWVRCGQNRPGSAWEASQRLLWGVSTPVVWPAFLWPGPGAQTPPSSGAVLFFTHFWETRVALLLSRRKGKPRDITERECLLTLPFEPRRGGSGKPCWGLWLQLTEPSLDSHFSQRSEAYSLPPSEPHAPPPGAALEHERLARAWSRPFLCAPLQIPAALALPGVCPALELLFKSARGPGQVA